MTDDIFEGNPNTPGMEVALQIPLEDLEKLDITYFEDLDQDAFAALVSRILGNEYDAIWREVLLSERLSERTNTALGQLNQSINEQFAERRSANSRLRALKNAGDYPKDQYERDFSDYQAWRKKALKFQQLVTRRHRQTKGVARRHRIDKHEALLAQQHAATRSALIRLAKGVRCHLQYHGDETDGQLQLLLDEIKIPHDGKMLTLREFVKGLENGGD